MCGALDSRVGTSGSQGGGLQNRFARVTVLRVRRPRVRSVISADEPRLIYCVIWLVYDVPCELATATSTPAGAHYIHYDEVTASTRRPARSRPCSARLTPPTRETLTLTSTVTLESSKCVECVCADVASATSALVTRRPSSTHLYPHPHSQIPSDSCTHRHCEGRASCNVVSGMCTKRVAREGRRSVSKGVERL